MATVQSVNVTIGIRRKPLLYVAALVYGLDNGRGGAFHRIGNRLVDSCVHVTT